ICRGACETPGGIEREEADLREQRRAAGGRTRARKRRQRACEDQCADRGEEAGKLGRRREIRYRQTALANVEVESRCRRRYGGDDADDRSISECCADERNEITKAKHRSGNARRLLGRLVYFGGRARAPCCDNPSL